MISNDEVAALMQAYRNRVLGAASANLPAPMEAVRELRRAVKTLGFRVLRLVPAGWRWLDERIYPARSKSWPVRIPDASG